MTDPLTTQDCADFELLTGLTEDQCAVIASLAHTVSYDVGRLIIEEGRTADRCWLIRSGEVSLEIHRPGMPANTLQTLGPGDVLGWSWLVSPHRWRFDARVTAPVTAIELDGVRLREHAEADPALGYALAVQMVKVLADRLHSTRARLEDLYGSPR